MADEVIDMNDQNNKPKESPKSIPGGAAARPKGLRRVLAKKWVTPAAFMAAAAIIVTLMWLYRGEQPDQTTTTPDTEVSQGDETQTKPADDTIAVMTGNEDLQWPVLNYDDLEVALHYYDEKGTNEEKQAALVSTSDNKFLAHTGVDLTKPDNSTFDVVAALSGKVSLVTNHPTNGQTVEITHGNGLVTVYQSLSDVSVKQGDEVKQGAEIAKAGRNDLESEEGIHLHFEIRQDGKVLNPNEYIKR